MLVADTTRGDHLEVAAESQQQPYSAAGVLAEFNNTQLR